jgi:hypothetical protein
VSWTPAQANGSALTGHTVTSSPGGHECTAATASTCRVAGLANGTAYTFTVTATNGVGTGRPSAPSPAVVPATVPEATSSLSAVAGNGSAQVSWPAAPDGGSPVTSYTVTSTPGSAQCTTAGELACAVTGLTNGTSYRFTVVASNALGAGPASAASAAVVPATTPSAPADVRALAGDGAVQVSWTAPADGGRPITGYTVTSTPGSVQCRTNTATACNLSGLTNGTAYTFTVTATNAVGAGATSAPTSAVTPSAGAPALPPPPPDGPAPGAAPAPNGPTARSIDAACPVGRVPASGFTDVAVGSTHERAISCLVWWKVANGRTSTSYAPAAGVTRDAMAAFVARTILAAKPGSLPDSPANAFTDDDASVHARAVDQLAAVGIVGGTGGGRYSPGAVVTRGQMAKFLAGAVAHVVGTPLTADRDLFTDDGASPFQDDINRVATVGITGGRSGRPTTPTGRCCATRWAASWPARSTCSSRRGRGCPADQGAGPARARAVATPRPPSQPGGRTTATTSATAPSSRQDTRSAPAARAVLLPAAQAGDVPSAERAATARAARSAAADARCRATATAPNAVAVKPASSSTAAMPSTSTVPLPRSPLTARHPARPAPPRSRRPPAAAARAQRAAAAPAP